MGIHPPLRLAGSNRLRGGGVYITPGGVVCISPDTRVKRNEASDSDDDVFGDFSTDC